MARVNKATAEAHRQELVQAAGRLFREKGLDAVGVAEISRAAGLTHGALYSGFASKRALAVAALLDGWAASRVRHAQAFGATPDLGGILDHYVSTRQRDDRVNCCAMVASASEAARQDATYRDAFAVMFAELAATVQGALERQGVAEAKRKALTLAAGMVGAVAVARSLEGAASDELLEAARVTLAELAVSDQAGGAKREE
jgi:TetR/AcrR family transcriptional regulator, transcriptional repressor for nem operon